MKNKHLAEKAHWVRKVVLEMAVTAKSGHVSTAYSQAEMLVALYYGGVLNFNAKDEYWPGRDRFILSKGQGGIGLYPILADLGYFPMEELKIFTGEGSILGVHADWHIPGIEVITGSLGHGLPIAVGKATALKSRNAKELVFCMLGDAELYEGSNWEAAFFASHKNLDNLICIVDRNGQGVLGKTDGIDSDRDGPRLEPLPEKFRAFGFETREVDGHDFDSILSAFSDLRSRSGRPLMVISNTIKGKGLPIMEDNRFWHYRVPQGQELEESRARLAGGGISK